MCFKATRRAVRRAGRLRLLLAMRTCKLRVIVAREPATVEGCQLRRYRMRPPLRARTCTFAAEPAAAAVPARRRPRRARRGAALRWQAAPQGGESRRKVREVRRHRAADSQRHDGASQQQQRRGGKAIRAALQAALQGPREGNLTGPQMYGAGPHFPVRASHVCAGPRRRFPEVPHMGYPSWNLTFVRRSVVFSKNSATTLYTHSVACLPSRLNLQE